MNLWAGVDAAMPAGITRNSERGGSSTVAILATTPASIFVRKKFVCFGLKFDGGDLSARMGLELQNKTH